MGGTSVRPVQRLGGRRDRRSHAGGGRQRGGSEGTRSGGADRPEEAGAAGPGAPPQTDTLPGQGALQTRAAPLFPFRSRRSGRQHQVPESAGIRPAVLGTRTPRPGTGPGLCQSGDDGLLGRSGHGGVRTDVGKDESRSRLDAGLVKATIHYGQEGKKISTKGHEGPRRFTKGS